MVDFKKIIPMQQEKPEAPDWMCYDCGSENGFHSQQDAWTLEWDTTCNACGSDNTGPHDDGRSDDCPLCEERGEGDENCPVCDGYATTYPFKVDEYQETVQKFDAAMAEMVKNGMIHSFQRIGLSAVAKVVRPVHHVDIKLVIDGEDGRMTEAEQHKVYEICLSSITRQRVTAEEQTFLSCMYAKDPDAYSRIHRSAKAEAESMINPLAKKE